VKRAYGLIGTGCLAALFWGGGPMFAQQSDSPEAGGPVLTFGIASTLSTTDNYNLDSNISETANLFDNRLSFGYLDRRANDVFRLDLNGVLRANEPPGGSRTFDDRNARLDYERQGANSALSFGADYNLASVDSFDPFDDGLFEDDPLEEGDLIQDRGDREQIAARFSFETGLSAPLGFALTGRYRDLSYANTTDPDLFDTQVLNLSATTRFTLSPVTEARVVLRYEDYSAADAPRTDRQTSSVNLGLRQALSEVSTLDILLGVQEIDTKETLMGVRQSDTDTGLTASINFSRELTRGTIGTSFVVSESVNGRTATWLVSRAMPLPRGALEISFGVASDVDDSIVPVGSLAFIHEMRRSTLTASLERQVSTSSRSNELRTTRAALDYVYEINSLSDLSFSANFVDLEQAGGPAVNDTTRTELRATYSRDLTRDWRVTSGYEYRMRDEEGVGDATSNRLFLTLERTFVTRP
jgi:hypothetical protein